jgi:uncharacterized damage-inducible protein DinB
MPDVQSYLRPPEGFRSREAALFFEQLEDQTRILLETVKDITPRELEWQPERGMNTIGMLLAHNAVAEVLWTQIGLQGMKQFDVDAAIGCGVDVDGMPVAPDAGPPENLNGKTLSYYEDLLVKARAYFKKVAVTLTDADLEKERTRVRDDGTKRDYTLRWVLYHMHEHFAGHRGQVQLLRHLYAATVGSPAR